MTRRGFTALLVLAGSGYAAGRLSTATVPLAGLHTTAGLVEGLVTNSVLIIGTVAALWYVLTALAVLVSTLGRELGASVTGLERVISRFGAPVLRRAVALTTATTLALATPSWASPLEHGTEEAPESTATASSSSPAGRNATFLVDLGWAPTPDPGGDGAPAGTPAVPVRPVGRETPPLPEEEPTRSLARHDARPSRSYTVQPGDSLWAIAASHLGAQPAPPSTEAIAAEWPRWYQANRGVIGPDPHLIHPGMTLIPPQPKETS